MIVPDEPLKVNVGPLPVHTALELVVNVPADVGFFTVMVNIFEYKIGQTPLVKRARYEPDTVIFSIVNAELDALLTSVHVLPPFVERCHWMTPELPVSLSDLSPPLQ